MITLDNINDKVFSHRPIDELFAIVKNDFKRFDADGLIDNGTLIKTVQYCNEKLGITVREIRECAVPVENYRAKLPLDFEKLYYTCALQATGTSVVTQTNPFDNTVDTDIVYEAKLDRESLGCVENYQVIVKRMTETTVHHHGSWIQLDIKGSEPYCHIDCPNKRKKGRYTISIINDEVECPFKTGTLYLMYIGMMKDKEGNITFPFHPLITPYYEWTVKEKILSDAIFNSDTANIGELYKIAQQERAKAWLDAFNFTTEKAFGEYAQMQRKKELSWYNQYFKLLQ